MNKNTVTSDLEIINNIYLLKQYAPNIILYGASKTGKRILELLKQLKINVCGFCESLPKQKEFCSMPVINPTELENIFKEQKLLIIVTSVYVLEIVSGIRKCNLKKAKIITYLGVDIAIDANIKKNFISKEFYTIYMAKKKLEIIKREKGYLQDTRELDLEHLISLFNVPQSILVYQPGKVGSSSIYKSIFNLKLPVIHLHRLAYNSNLFGDENISAYNELMEQIKQSRIKIITGVREPISRDISNFIHNLNDGRWYTYSFLNQDINDTFQKVVDKYYVNKNYKHELRNDYKWLDISWNCGKYGQMFEWFDFELKKVFGIDIYDYPFDKEKGITIIKKDNIEIFLYKLEQLNNNEKELGKFIGNSKFTLLNDNVGNEKKYKYLYEEFLQNLKISKNYFEIYYLNNEKMKHFYTEKEISIFMQKWEKYIINN